MKRPEFLALFTHKRHVLTKEQIIKDAIAGTVVAIIALPLSIAIGISSGVSPEKGLITAIIASICVSLFGGSRVQIGGPTGGFVVIVYGIIQKYGFGGLVISSLMAGIILIILGLLRTGGLIKFIPRSIILGFTAGIGVTLFTAQIKDLFGLHTGKLPVGFTEKWHVYAENFGSMGFAPLGLGILAILIIVFFPKINKTVPSSLVALIAVTIVAVIFKFNVATIGSAFGSIKATMPVIQIPDLSLANIKIFIEPALTIAILAYLQALLTAVVTDDMLGDKHSSNTELISQGISNIVLALLGGIPATGAIARTTASVKSGGRTPIAGLIHAGILLIVLIVFMPLLAFVPLSVLAAILIVVSYNMCEVKLCMKLINQDKWAGAELVGTLVLTVFLNLVLAIGIVLAIHLIRTKVINKIMTGASGSSAVSSNIELG